MSRSLCFGWAGAPLDGLTKGPKGSLEIEGGDTRFARYFCLTEPAGIDIKTVVGPGMFGPYFVKVGLAFLFVMSCFGNRTGRAALHAGPACAFTEKETILSEPLGLLFSGRDIDAGYHGAAAHGLPDRSNQAITEAKCAQSRRIGGVPLRPVGGIDIVFGHPRLPSAETDRGPWLCIRLLQVS